MINIFLIITTLICFIFGIYQFINGKRHFAMLFKPFVLVMMAFSIFRNIGMGTQTAVLIYFVINLWVLNEQFSHINQKNKE